MSMIGKTIEIRFDNEMTEAVVMDKVLAGGFGGSSYDRYLVRLGKKAPYKTTLVDPGQILQIIEL